MSIYLRGSALAGIVASDIAQLGALVDAMQRHHAIQVEAVEVGGSCPDDDLELLAMTERGENLERAGAAMFGAFYLLYEAGQFIAECPDTNAEFAASIDALVMRGKGC